MTSEEVLLEKFKVLPVNRQQELLDFAEFLEQKESVKKPHVSLKGIQADMNINITDEDIREAQNEMWRGYTKDTENEKQFMADLVIDTHTAIWYFTIAVFKQKN